MFSQSDLYGIAIVDDDEALIDQGVVISTITRTAGPGFERLELRSTEVSRARMIRGVCATGRMWNDIVLNPLGCELVVGLPLLVEHAQNQKGKQVAGLTLHEMAIGSVVTLEKRAAFVAFEAVVFRTQAADAVWTLMQTGSMKAISMHVVPTKVAGVVNGTRFFDTWTIHELSCCKEAANIDCFARIVSNTEIDHY